MTELVLVRLTMRLFGGFSVTRDGVSVPGLHLREGERLLAYLTLYHSTPITYRTLAGLFWPSEARNESGEFPSTRQAIYSLRQHLGDDAGMLASVGKGVVQLNLDGVDCDLLAFDAHAASPEPQDWQHRALWSAFTLSPPGIPISHAAAWMRSRASPQRWST